MSDKVKTYAWNFREVGDDGVLVLRAISSDSIGVLRLQGGTLQFWSKSVCVIRTKSFAELFKAIDKTERET